MAIVVATTSAVIAGRGGEKIRINRGEGWDADHPVVTTHPDMFSADPADARGSEIPDETVSTPRKPRVKKGDVTRGD